MKDGQIEKQLKKKLVVKKAAKTNNERALEFFQDINGTLSHKRAIAIIFALAAIACALLDKDVITTATFVAAATGTGYISTREKKQIQE